MARVELLMSPDDFAVYLNKLGNVLFLSILFLEDNEDSMCFLVLKCDPNPLSFIIEVAFAGECFRVFGSVLLEVLLVPSTESFRYGQFTDLLVGQSGVLSNFLPIFERF